MSGCIFSPKKGTDPPPPPPSYPRETTPVIVIDNLRTAYIAKDSTKYKDLFDDTYTGTSQDNTDPSPTTLPFTKADEAAHIRGLARSAVSSISIDLDPVMQPYHDGGDPANYKTINKPIIRVNIVDPSNNTTYDVPFNNETVFYKFVGTFNPGPNDTTWKIIQWTEIRN